MSKWLGVLCEVLILGACMFLYLFNGTTTFNAKTIMDNPAIGFAPMAQSNYAENENLVYVNLPWSEWEPEKGQYAYDAISESKHR